MRTIEWTRRLAVTGAAAGIGLAVAGVGTASAQGDPPTGPAPITITVSAAQVQQLCETKLPPLKAKVAELVTWINAGPTVPGSTQWLRALAQQAAANGHPARADILNGKAEERTGVLTILQDIQTKINDFDAAHCAYLGSGQ